MTQRLPLCQKQMENLTWYEERNAAFNASFRNVYAFASPSISGCIDIWSSFSQVNQAYEKQII